MTQQQHNPTITEEQLDDLPSKLPEGLVLPDGRVLTYAPHQLCGDCADCEATFEAFQRDELDLQQAVGVVT